MYVQMLTDIINAYFTYMKIGISLESGHTPKLVIFLKLVFVFTIYSTVLAGGFGSFGPCWILSSATLQLHCHALGPWGPGVLDHWSSVPEASCNMIYYWNDEALKPCARWGGIM